MKIGIVVNPYAGGKKIPEEVIKEFSDLFSGFEFYCLDTCRNCSGNLLSGVKHISPQRTFAGKNHSVDSGFYLDFVDLVAVFGGDGTISDVIYGQRLRGVKIPIFGIGTGTANAGPFICATSPPDFRTFESHGLKTEAMSSIDVYDEDNLLVGSSYVDVVFSDCNLSTVNGSIATVCSDSYISGSRIPRNPRSIWTEDFFVNINGSKAGIPFESKQIVASIIRDRESFSKRAVFGIINWMPYSEKKAVITISGEIIIKITGKEDCRAENGMLVKQHIFGEDDTIELGNCLGYVVIDGNPLKKMGRGKRVFLKYNDFSALRIVGDF